MVTKNKKNTPPAPAHMFIRNNLRSEKGLVLIAALFMMVVLAGVVLICAYPLAYEKKSTVRHHITLERLKAMERGAFGRLAGQRGGKFNACGGYFSDSGWKVIQGSEAGELRKMAELWCLKKELPILKDIYRYDKDYGFWVGYRGKRYLVRPPCEEHMREKKPLDPIQYGNPIFIDGDKKQINYKGYRARAFHYSLPYNKGSHPERHYNPVEKLVINVKDHRMSGLLSAQLIYAAQPEFGQVPVVTKKYGILENSQFDYTFIFDMDDSAGGGSGSICPGATFQIGLSKLIIYEDGIPMFTQAVCVPPAKEFRSTDHDLDKINNSLYSITIDYE